MILYQARFALFFISLVAGLFLAAQLVAWRWAKVMVGASRGYVQAVISFVVSGAVALWLVWPSWGANAVQAPEGLLVTLLATWLVVVFGWVHILIIVEL